MLSSSTVSSNWTTVKAVYNPQCLSVLIKLLDVGVVTGASGNEESLTAEEKRNNYVLTLKC